jgi:DNA repair protein RAD5
VVESLTFAPIERKFYDSIYEEVKEDFERLDARGLVGKNYTHILAMLMRYGVCPFFTVILTDLFL